MNKTIVALLAFVCGGGVGYLVAVKVLEEKYEKIAQEEIDSVKEYYADKDLAKYAEADAKAVEQLYAEANGMTDDQYEGRTNKVPLVRSSINQAGETGKRVVTSYDSVAKAQINLGGSVKGIKGDPGETHAESEEDDPETDTDEPYVDAARMYEGDMVNTSSGRDLRGLDRTAPYVISDIEYSEEFPHHDKVSVYLYSDDGVLCDEGEEPIIDIAGTVGYEVLDILETQSSAWARNERIGTDFEICVVRGSYAQLVSGQMLSPREAQERRTKRRSSNGE